jgi:phosphatidate cytidylyltransferase
MNFHYIFYLLFIIWFSDSGAYIFGIKFGKHRMYEKISPKKSMEGLYAGIICGVLAAIIYNTLFLNIPFIHLIISGVLVSSAGVIGDLIESMFKRYADVKDSGNIFPGHGGMLDRIDSILLGAPVLYFYLKFISAQ